MLTIPAKIPTTRHITGYFELSIRVQNQKVTYIYNKYVAGYLQPTYYKVIQSHAEIRQ